MQTKAKTTKTKSVKVSKTTPKKKAPAKKVAKKNVEPAVEPVVVTTDNVTDMVDMNALEPDYTLKPIYADVNAYGEDQKEIKRLLIENNLDWDVRKEDLIAISTFEANGCKGQHLNTPNSGIFRNDNNVHLGTTSKKYTTYQNSELVACIYEASKSVNLEITGGGECYDGERVFLDLKLPDVRIGKALIKRSITCLNAHNGRGSVQFGATYSIHLPNQDKPNTFLRVFQGNGKFYHYANVSQRVKSAIAGLFQSLAKEEKTIETMKAMTKKTVPTKLLHEIVLKCFRVDLNQNKDDVSTRTLNNMNGVSDRIQKAVSNADNTLWGLFNGILETTADRTPKNQDSNDYVKAGRGNLVNAKAFDIIQNYLESTK